jgi:formylglycine-generating enzyme required for sulfatase activity
VRAENRFRKKSVVNIFSLAAAGAVICTICLSCGRVPKRGMAEIKAKGKTLVVEAKSGKWIATAALVLDRDFLIDRTEVTQGFFQKIMGYNPSAFTGDTSRPVESVSFIEAAQFCNKRSAAEGLEACYLPASWACDRSKNGYRLPTEAEWEFACRAGKNTPFFWGKSVSPNYCWFKENSNGATHPVATVKPNRFGLYDMAGNVWEWCDDHFNADRTAKTGGHWELGPKTLRGGSWSSTPDLVGSAVRDGGDPMGKSNGVGFRCVRNCAGPDAKPGR